MKPQDIRPRTETPYYAVRDYECGMWLSSLDPIEFSRYRGFAEIYLLEEAERVKAAVEAAGILVFLEKQT